MKLRDPPKKSEAKSYNIDGIHVYISYTEEGGIPLIHEVTLRHSNIEMEPHVRVIGNLLSLLFRGNIPYGEIVKSLREGGGIYSDLADVIQMFLSEFGVMNPPEKVPTKQETILTFVFDYPEREEPIEGEGLSVCPVCGKQTLKVEEGCYTCLNPECGWSKCEL